MQVQDIDCAPGLVTQSKASGGAVSPTHFARETAPAQIGPLLTAPGVKAGGIDDCLTIITG
ncbi:MAG: hypothetical protein JF620_10825 [Mesorhizobium sp.]|nr:hypothetical protein [Mesorhizobium sp.]